MKSQVPFPLMYVCLRTIGSAPWMARSSVIVQKSPVITLTPSTIVEGSFSVTDVLANSDAPEKSMEKIADEQRLII